jgi:hypothetical protein
MAAMGCNQSLIFWAEDASDEAGDEVHTRPMGWKDASAGVCADCPSLPVFNEDISQLCFNLVQNFEKHGGPSSPFLVADVVKTILSKTELDGGVIGRHGEAAAFHLMQQISERTDMMGFSLAAKI